VSPKPEGSETRNENQFDVCGGMRNVECAINRLPRNAKCECDLDQTVIKTN
jgi:hypothetical protein